jgi:hypothetical protein
MQLKVLGAWRRAFGIERLDSRKSMADLAATCLRLQQWKEAEKLEEKVLERAVEEFG